MRLDLLIPTFERPELLRVTLASVARASRPRAMEVSVTVINNAFEPLAGGPELSAGPYPLRVLHERRRGKSAALNAGIATSTADYIGLIDDDEEIAADWFLVVERALEGRQFDFIGGRTTLFPTAPSPAWIPPGYPAVLGSSDSGPAPVTYGLGSEGTLDGGNAVISRAMLRVVGPYSTSLGPRVDRRLSSCEDEDMYLRLIDAGARGQYVPELVVHHRVQPERLQKSYYRSWSFWNGASRGVLSRRRQAAGAPRITYGDAFRGLLTWTGAVLTFRPASTRLAGELPVWHLAGQFYGRYLQRDDPRRTTSAATSVLFTALLACVAVPAFAQSPGALRAPDVMFVPTPQEVVDAMLRLADVTAADVVYDLGSGDGRIPITAAQEFGATGVGIELNPDLIKEASENAARAGVGDKVRFLNQDLFETDLRPATVITLYLLREMNLKLMPTLKQLKPGTRIVAHSFGMGSEWTPDKIEQVSGKSIFYWVVK